ncbi:hypothetical protein Sme01_30840 [Sphaerisporangium melleum]|uniref:Secreted protein n=1 Tax=Sphaerisporangium melleum TaxID=321316 RepID=A0A917R9D1_9ACTN|nr:hypothetical protein [Sphaerisporangium melleum]GGK95472.1 hypothetical protein GCM10007964_42270 [Sphaerisporangium melleum]GII70608.1 hypothetical protein Sme01_30840 [Sphaerisporangium melleum]
MTITWVAVVVAAVVAILAVGYLVARQQRRHRLQERFGPEYERAVREGESRRAAEQELIEREQRHAELDIRPLTPESRSTYGKKWAEVQERFVDAPGFAVTEADHLVTAVMAERGYPTDGFEQQLSDLSVAHGGTLDHYRKAHEISSRAARREASTEELRQAMVHYRALFQELLEDTPSTGHDHRGAAADLRGRDDERHQAVHRNDERDLAGENDANDDARHGMRAVRDQERELRLRREQDRRQYGGQVAGDHGNGTAETGAQVAGGRTSYRNTQGG